MDAAFDQKCLESLLRSSSLGAGGGDHDESGGIDSVSLAIDNITFFDDELTEQSHPDGSHGFLSRSYHQHHSRNSQPDVAFDQCSFEELHLRLRPYFYGDETWTRPQFTTAMERRVSSDHLVAAMSLEAKEDCRSRSSSDGDEFVGYEGVFLSSSQQEGEGVMSGEAVIER
jgi:hypothetical protein